MLSADRFDQVIAALDRLATGVFARCDVCGNEIDDRRLCAAPDADRCDRHTGIELGPALPGADTSSAPAPGLAEQALWEQVMLLGSVSEPRATDVGSAGAAAPGPGEGS